MDFYYNGDLKYTDQIPPYQYIWKRHPLPIGKNFRIRAYDTEGHYNDKTFFISKVFQSSILFSFIIDSLQDIHLNLLKQEMLSAGR